MLKRVFIHPFEHRLRAGWRLLLFMAAVPVTVRLLMLSLCLISGELAAGNTARWVFRGIVVVTGGTLLVFLFRKIVDRRPFLSLGLKFNKQAIHDMLVGFVISGSMVGLFFAALVAMGMLEIKGVGWTSTAFSPALEIVLLLFGIGLATGYSEEIGFRGYILQNLIEGIGLGRATILSCVGYGLMHMANPNSTPLSGILIAMFGFMRIFGWLRTGQLWLSIGMHAGWNFFQGPIFGFSVSGLGSESLIHHSLTGPDWLTGGTFGPEAGIMVMPVALLALIAMFLWTIKRSDTLWRRTRRSVT